MMHKKKYEFSKLIIIQESILVWISTLFLLFLAYKSVLTGYIGSLPYLTTLVGAIWAAYGVSVGFYYNKAKAENLKKLRDLENQIPYENMDRLKSEEAKI